jgi:hypothetical protein
MRTGSKSLAWFLIGVLAVIPALAADAQEAHVADQAAIEKAISERSNEDDANREAILELLRRPEVRELAGKVKLDLQQAETAVATLDGDELAEIASMAREAESRLSGGETITISTTVIIIGLLVLILIIVAT